MRGFVRKMGRSTKGGSLSANGDRERVTSVGSRDSGRLARENGQVNNGRNGNGSMADFSPNRFSSLLRSIVVTRVGAGEQTEGLDSNGYRRSSSLSPNGDIVFERLANHLPVDLAHMPIPRWKRALDVSCVLLASPFWLPLMLMVMAIIRLNSRGPIFYRQERVGFRGSHFLLFKFRTMHVNAETRTHEDYFATLMRSNSPMTKLDAAGDSRLIPWGRFLRASGLDELPQIFNVLRGDMSLVGPRPCLPIEFARYEDWHRQRVHAPPGLTGYWQVNGKNNTTFQEMIEMDLFYAENMSFGLDLRIMFKTIPVLLDEMKQAWDRYRLRVKTRPPTAVLPSVAIVHAQTGAAKPE